MYLLYESKLYFYLLEYLKTIQEFNKNLSYVFVHCTVHSFNTTKNVYNEKNLGASRVW